MGDNLLDVKGLSTYYYTNEGIVKAIDNISLKLDKGVTMGIVGESGCGKSTLGLSITRLIRKPGKIVDGEILFNGKDILKLSSDEIREMRGRDISMIFQDPTSSLNPVFSIGSQIEEAVKLHQNIKNKSEIRKRVIDILEKVGISDATRRFTEFPHQFSGGMRQRVMIAMALSCNPNLLIADEPTTSLDVTIQAQILDLMQDLKKEFNSAIILITHNVAVVAEVCDTVAVMYAGKIVEYSTVRNIYKKSKHPYTKALLSAIPRADQTIEKLVTIPGNVPSLINPPEGCIFSTRCSYATKECLTEISSMLEVDKDHFVSCHLYK